MCSSAAYYGAFNRCAADATGLSIYVPFRKSEYEISSQTYGQTLFTQETMWDEFMSEVSWV